MTLRTVALACSVAGLLAPLALAQTAEKKPEAKPAAAAPKPAPELDQLKYFAGAWQCTGKAPASPFGPEHKTTAAVKIGLDLGGFWYATRYTETKTPDNPSPVSAQVYWGYDAAAKKFLAASLDNMGGLAHQTSSGWEGDKMVWTGEVTMGAEKMPARDTFTKKGPSEVVHTGEISAKGQWTVTDEETCKKPAPAIQKK